MEDFKILVIQVVIGWTIGLLGYIALGIIFAGWAVFWTYMENLF